jgi:hypothetical protein
MGADAPSGAPPRGEGGARRAVARELAASEEEAEAEALFGDSGSDVVGAPVRQQRSGRKRAAAPRADTSSPAAAAVCTAAKPAPPPQQQQLSSPEQDEDDDNDHGGQAHAVFSRQNCESGAGILTATRWLGSDIPHSDE